MPPLPFPAPTTEVSPKAAPSFEIDLPLVLLEVDSSSKRTNGSHHDDVASEGSRNSHASAAAVVAAVTAVAGTVTEAWTAARGA